MSPLKWCAGPCGRLLPRSEFHLGGPSTHGNRKRYPNGRCKGCHRVVAREHRRRKARHQITGRAFKASDAARHRAAYWARKAAA